MEHEKIERISELTRLSRERELTHEELVEREALRRRLAELDELERQAREAAAQAEEAAPGEGGAEITEIHGGPQEHDSEES